MKNLTFADGWEREGGGWFKAKVTHSSADLVFVGYIVISIIIGKYVKIFCFKLQQFHATYENLNFEGG